MINQTDYPVAWALLLYEIDEVREHLESLAKQMSEAGRIDEEELEVQIGHVYAHLNRIWHRRDNGSGELTREQWEAFSRFPDDIEPVG